VIFESVEELSQNFIFSLLASLDIGMLLGVVGLSDVVDVELS